MADLSKFTLDNKTINVKDTTARTAASNAQSLATTASGNATSALNKVAELEKLSRVEISYDSTSETMTIVTGTHGVA